MGKEFQEKIFTFEQIRKGTLSCLDKHDEFYFINGRDGLFRSSGGRPCGR